MEGGLACHIAGYNKVQVLLSQSCVFISLRVNLINIDVSHQFSTGHF